MTFVLDAQLPPRLAGWLEERFGVEARAIRDLGLVREADHAVFARFAHPGTVIVTKDRDFVDLVLRSGPPPQVLWVTCGNCSNAHLESVFDAGFERARGWLEAGEPAVEIAG